jgi:hypothetical protein
VPLEYRQQLSAGVQSKRTLASFFSPGKSKQWKQAATLNGRPYVVGHVPRGLNYREAEFEGLLLGNNSSTKVISLSRDGPVKREVSHSEGFGSSLSPGSRRTRAEDISSPLFVGSREDTTPRASTPVVPVVSPAPASTTKRRFRLPTGLPLTPNARTSGLTPSQAEDIDFETRLASYSDDELNSINTTSRKLSKEERRRSKDDAWVDILVASHSRRANNQDAEHRRAGGPRQRNVNRQDPELASLEVAQVLAGVRGPSPPLDGESVDIEPMNVPHRSKIDNLGSPLEEQYPPTIPSSFNLDLMEPEEVVQEVEAPPPRPQRRMGYFDIHPERRHQRVGPGTGAGEDIFDQFARAADEEENDDPPRTSDVTESVYSGGATPPASPLPAIRTQLQPGPISPVAFPTSSSHASPLPSPSIPPPGPVPVPAPTQIPSPRDLQRQQEVRDRLSGKPGPKASSLIEMYREKERQASGGSENSPGKSSTATSIVKQQRQPQLSKESTLLPLPPPPPPPSSELSISPVDTPVMGQGQELEPDQEVGGDGVIEPPPNLEFDSGRDSPYRYVHGAPLHNVVEEEEEE